MFFALIGHDRAKLCFAASIEFWQRIGLEGELQPELHHATASRTDQRIGGRVVGRGAAAAKRAAGRRVIAETRAIRCAVWIGDIGVIENVKELHPELGAEPLLERETLEHGEIHVLEARVTEDVPAHGAKGSGRGRQHDRVADHEAATRRKRSGVGGDCLTLIVKRCGEWGNLLGYPGLLRATKYGGFGVDEAVGKAT